MQRCAIAVVALCCAAAVVARGELLPPMTRSEAAKAVPCCVTGVVTMVSSWRPNSCVIADVADPNGVAVYVSGETFQQADSDIVGTDALRAGQIVEVVGETARFSFAPGVKARSISKIGQMELPAPPLYRLRDFDRGVMDNRRAALEGVLVEASAGRIGFAEAIDDDFTRLLMSTPDGLFVAHVPGESGPWEGLVDAQLRLEGCAMTFFNLRAEFVGLQLEVASEAGVKVLRGPPVSPLALPQTPLDELLAPQEGIGQCHRKRVRGIVTYSKAGDFFYLQSGAQTVKIRTHEKDALAPGDEVDAVGFAFMQGSMGELRGAVYRGTGRREALVPLAVEPEWLVALPVQADSSYINLDGRLIEVEGGWVRSEPGEGDVHVYVSVGSRLVLVHADAATAAKFAPEWNELRPNVKVTGVCALEMEAGLPAGRVPEVKSAEIYVDGVCGTGIVPIRDEHWRRVQRRAWLEGGLFALVVAAAAVACVMFFRWRKMQHDARHLAAVVAERKRMAGDLHDTIEQHLAGARMLLKSALAMNPATPEGVKTAIGTASGILAQAKTEIRETVWNLRSDELFEEKPADVLKSLARRINESRAVKVRTFLRGLPEKPDRRVFADIVFIVQEAITNAVKHGKAKNVAITCDPMERGSGFVLRVSNDGERFDPAAALGPEAGHFGLAGMRERARRNGIRLWFDCEGKMVSLVLEVAKWREE